MTHLLVLSISLLSQHAFMMGSNHIAAFLAFNSVLDVVTAVAAHSLITAVRRQRM